METLAYSHLATAEESSTFEPIFEGVNWKKFSSLGLMGLLSVATILGAISATANSAAACYNPCRGYGRRHVHRPQYRRAAYSQRRRRGGYYLSYGHRGASVYKLQHQLGTMGYFHHPRATGYFGYKTRFAVKAFQRAHGLRPDGIVGPRTRAALSYY